MSQATHEFKGSVDFNQYELRNASFQNLITPPLDPVQGQLYFNSRLELRSPFYWNSNEWIPFGLKPIHKRYNDQASMLADQLYQISGYIYYRIDQDIYYEKEIGSTSSMSDYNPIGGSGTLTGYVPYTGATGNVDLGEYGINSGYYKYDTTPTSTPTTQGSTYWDVDDNTVAIIMNGAIQKVGEDSFYPVKNQTGSTILKGTAVRFAGTVGASSRLLIAPFIANGSVPSSYFMGITMEDIANGADGKVMWFGRVRGINTNAFNEGDILYASTTVAGGFQTTVPQAPNNIVQIAAVITKHVNQGTIFIRPLLGSNINLDEGVKIATPTQGDLLQYQNTTGLWENTPLSLLIGYGLSLDTNNKIQLGTEEFLGNRTVNIQEWEDSDYSEFILRNSDSSNYFLMSNSSTEKGLYYYSFLPGGNDFVELSLFSGSVYLSRAIMDGATQKTQLLMFDTSTNNYRAIFRDDINLKGIEYASDYELNFTARSLVTKQYVDGAISSGAYIHPTYTPVSQTLSGATVLASFSSDSIGSVTGFTTRTLTPSDIGAESIFSKGNIIQGNAITLTGTLTSRLVGTGDITIAHADTSSQANVSNTGGSVIQSVSVDTYGHVTVLSSIDLDTRYYTETETNTLLNNYQLLSQKGVANGYVPLDSSGKIPTAYIPDSILGQVTYVGTWNATTNSPTLPSPSTVKGDYYIVTVAGTYLGTDYQIGDWIISDGVAWTKVDNSDSVTSVFGRTGNVVANEADYQSFYPRLSQTYADPTWISSLAWSKITGTPTTLAGYGITDAVPSNRTLTINGIAFDLTANRSWSVGTVTSVALSLPSIFSVTGSPITTSGTLTATLASQTANTVFAAPNGVAGAPTFRSLAAADIPTLPITTKVSAGNWRVFYSNGTGVITELALGAANTFLRSEGAALAPTFATITGSEITGAALTKTDDTNVTLTLGGTPATSLLRATSLTLGWTGQLAVSRGGTGASTLTGVVIGTGTTAMVAVAGTGSQLLRRNAGNTAYEFFTHDFINQAGARTAISLTTTGTSGVATYNNTTGVFNIPNYTYTHPSYTALSPVLTGANVLATFTTDATGHVTAATTRVLTPADIAAEPAFSKGSLVQGTGLSLSGTLTSRLVGTGDITVSHADTSTQASVVNTGGNIIQSVSVDDFGHVTSLGSMFGDDRWARRHVLIDSSSTWLYTAEAGTYPGIHVGQITTGSSNFPSTLGGYAIFGGGQTNSVSYFARVFGFFRQYDSTNVYVGTANDNGANNGWALIYTSYNLTLSTLGGTPTTRTITINGTTQDLSADRTWNVGTVTSVALSAPVGFVVSGSPVTSTGTLSLAFDTGYSLPTTAKQTEWDTAYTNRITSLTTTGNSGTATLISNVLNIPNYTLAGLGGEPSITAGTTAQYWRGDKTWQTLNTAAVPESGNLYYTDARARASISLTTTGTSGAATYSSATGVLNIPTYTLAGLGGFSNPMTTLGDIIYGGASGTPTRLAGNTTTVKQFLSQTGTGTISAIPSWSAITGADVTGAALTKTDDTNVTLTLGGTPATALLRAASLTLGWTGTLAVGRGGSGASTLTGVLIGNGTSAFTGIAGTASQLLRRNAGNTAYEFFTHDFINQAGARSAISLTTTGTSGVATYSSATGVLNIPNYTYTHPTYTARNITATGAQVLSTFTSDVSGHVTGITTRALTPADIGAQVAGNYVTKWETWTSNFSVVPTNNRAKFYVNDTGYVSFQTETLSNLIQSEVYFGQGAWYINTYDALGIQNSFVDYNSTRGYHHHATRLDFATGASFLGIVLTNIRTEINTSELTFTNLSSVSSATEFFANTATGVKYISAANLLTSIGGASSSHNHTLDSLSNVTITSNTNGEILRWNGTAWVNNTLAEAGIQPAGSYGLSNADITAVSLTSTTLTLTRASGNLTASVPTFNQNTTGSAATLTTARTLTIGSTGKTFNGSANVSWSLSEIGAQAAGNYILRQFVSDQYTDISNSDLNTFSTGVTYAGSSSTNRPPSGNSTILSIAQSALYGYQLGGRNRQLYWRDNENGVWDTWQRVYLDSYHPIADAWTTARTITIGSTGKSVDGSANVSWSLAEIGAQAAGNYVTTDTTQTITGEKTFSNRTLKSNFDVSAVGDTQVLSSVNNFSAGYIYNGALNSPQSGNLRYAEIGSFHLAVFDSSGSANPYWIRHLGSGGTFSTWKRIFTDDYHPNADTLTTTRTIWGQNFNGSANVTGALSGATTISMSGQLTNTVAVGTAPFVITSTTRVSNLNVATAGTADTWTTARTITIGSTGKSVNGSANVSWSLAEIGAQAVLTNPVTGTGVSGQVSFWTGTTTQGGSTNLFWNNSTNRLGVGTSSPQTLVDITGDFTDFSGGAYTATQSALNLYNSNITGVNQGAILAFQSEYDSGGGVGIRETVALIKGANDIWANNGAGNLQFFTSATGAANNLIERWRINSTGVLQSNGAQTIQTSTGNLTLSTAGGNGNILLTPNGTGNVTITTNSIIATSVTPTLSIISTTTTGVTIGNKGNRLLLQSNSTTVGNGGEIVWGVADTNVGRWGAISGHIQSNSSGSATGFITFATKSLVSDTVLIERMRIHSSGNILIGTTTDSGDNLRVNGTVRLDSVTNATGDFVRIDANNVLRRRTAAETVTDLGISPSSFQRDKFIFSGTYSFTLTRTSPNAVMVFLNGQKLQFTDDWSISGNVVTVTTDLWTGAEISIEYFYSTPDVVPSGINGTGTINYITKWNTTTQLGVSLIQDDGSVVTLPAATDVLSAIAATVDTDKFMVLDGNRIKFRTGSEVLSDIGVRTAISLTTTGTSGLATYNSTTGVFNIPNYTYTHPAYTTRSITATGASVLSTFTSDALGHVTGITTRTLTAADIGAAASSHNQAASTITAGTFATGDFVFPGNLDINGQLSSPANAKGNSGTGTVTFNWNDGNVQTVTLNGNCTFALSNGKSGASYQIIVAQDGTVRTVTWSTTVKWSGGTAPTFTGTTGKFDIITISFDGTNYFGVISKNH